MGVSLARLRPGGRALSFGRSGAGLPLGGGPGAFAGGGCVGPASGWCCDLAGRACLGPVGRRRALLRDVFVAPLEPFDATRGVDQLLLAGEERVALGADLETHVVLRRTGGDGLAARAGDVDDLVHGVDPALHVTTPYPVLERRIINGSGRRRQGVFRRRPGPRAAPMGRTWRAGGSRAYPMLLMEDRNSSLFLVFCILSIRSG